MRQGDRLLVVIITAIAAMAAGWYLPLNFNRKVLENFGKGVISYPWAGICGFGVIASIVSYNDSSGDANAVIGITVVLIIVSMTICRKRTLALANDVRLANWSMLFQAIAPLGMLGIALLLTEIFGKKDNKKK